MNKSTKIKQTKTNPDWANDFQPHLKTLYLVTNKVYEITFKDNGDKVKGRNGKEFIRFKVDMDGRNYFHDVKTNSFQLNTIVGIGFPLIGKTIRIMRSGRAKKTFYTIDLVA